MKKDRYVDTNDWKGEVSEGPEVSEAVGFRSSLQLVGKY
jgi:hypothetical protein